MDATARLALAAQLNAAPRPARSVPESAGMIRPAWLTAGPERASRPHPLIVRATYGA